MTKQAEKKTNAMRELERAGQSYEAHSFECPEAISGVEVARVLNEDPDCVFKTLVTVGKSGDHYVFMIPVAMELDLKKLPLRLVKNRSIWSNQRNCLVLRAMYTAGVRRWE